MKVEGQKNIGVISLLLSLTAGYTDTTTFMSADRLFSAHVTGNFVVFVYNVMTGADSTTWLHLLSFPFFVGAVGLSNLIFKKTQHPDKVLKVVGLILLMAGMAAVLFKLTANESQPSTFFLSMIMVVAMGIQNGFGKLFPKVTYAPTTVMTGNVTQITIDFTNYVREKKSVSNSIKSLKQQSFIIGGFFTGCLLGGIASYAVGLSAILIPGIILTLFSLRFQETKD
jgi:uncharacterized membrane protein YoaK (UPF0700 family)